METTKEKKDFSSRSDSIVRLISTKHKEIEAEAKQLLGLKEEELERKSKQLAERFTRLERKSKELVEISTRLELDKEKLGLRSKQVEERWRDLEIHAVEIDEDRYTVSEQLRELELKNLQFEQREEEIESRCKEIDRILKKLEVDKKKLEERIHEIDCREKQMEGRIERLHLLSKDLERQSMELDSNHKKPDERMHKLDQKERQLDERVQLFASSKRRLDEDGKKLDFRIREVSCRQRELDKRLEQVKLKENSLNMKSKEIDSILEKFEVDKKKLEVRNHEIDRKVKHMEGRIKVLDLQSKDLERQRSKLDSDRKTTYEQMHKLNLKARQLDERVQLFASSKRRLDEDGKKLDFRFREVNCREKELDKGLEQVKLKENLLDMKSKDIDLKQNCEEIVMDGETLQIFLNERFQNHEKMGDEVSFLLCLSQDPAKLVLDALEGFFPPHLRNGNGEEFSGNIVQRSCILLLQQLLKISHDIKIKPEVKNEARRLSCVWFTKLKPEREHPMEILGFLLVLAIYDVVSVFNADEIFNYVKTVSHFEQLPELCCLLGMTDKITGLIQDLVERKQHLVAIRYTYDYNLIEKFPLGSLLKDHVETSRIESAAIIKSGNKSRIAQSQARMRMISNLEAAITCIEKYNISSEYSPANLRQMIAFYKHDDKEKQKETAFHDPAAAVIEAPQLQQTGTCSSIPSSSIGLKLSQTRKSIHSTIKLGNQFKMTCKNGGKDKMAGKNGGKDRRVDDWGIITSAYRQRLGVVIGGAGGSRLSGEEHWDSGSGPGVVSAGGLGHAVSPTTFISDFKHKMQEELEEEEPRVDVRSSKAAVGVASVGDIASSTNIGVRQGPGGRFRFMRSGEVASSTDIWVSRGPGGRFMRFGGVASSTDIRIRRGPGGRFMRSTPVESESMSTSRGTRHEGD